MFWRCYSNLYSWLSINSRWNINNVSVHSSYFLIFFRYCIHQQQQKKHEQIKTMNWNNKNSYNMHEYIQFILILSVTLISNRTDSSHKRAFSPIRKDICLHTNELHFYLKLNFFNFIWIWPIFKIICLKIAHVLKQNQWKIKRFCNNRCKSTNQKWSLLAMAK